MFQKPKGRIISDAICGILMLLSILSFVLIGLFMHIWHPTWVIIVCSSIVCGVVTICVNSYYDIHRQPEVKEETKDAKVEKKETKQK